MGMRYIFRWVIWFVLWSIICGRDRRFLYGNSFFCLIIVCGGNDCVIVLILFFLNLVFVKFLRFCVKLWNFLFGGCSGFIFLYDVLEFLFLICVCWIFWIVIFEKSWWMINVLWLFLYKLYVNMISWLYLDCFVIWWFLMMLVIFFRM